DQHVGTEGHQHRGEALRGAGTAQQRHRRDQVTGSAGGLLGRHRCRSLLTILLACHPPVLTHRISLVEGQMAWRRMARRALWSSGTGLPCMLLDRAALAAMSSASCGPMPNAASRGTPSRVTVSRIQARPSAMEAEGFPVITRAASA